MKLFYSLLLTALTAPTVVAGNHPVAGPQSVSFNLNGVVKSVEIRGDFSSRKKSTHKTRSEADVITEAPGEESIYFRNVEGFSVDFMGMPIILTGSGVAQKMKFDGDDVYMFSPSFTFPTDSWIKGSLTDEGLVFPLPQSIFREYDDDPDYGYEMFYDLNYFQLYHDDDYGDFYAMPYDDVPNALILKKQEDGSYGYEPELEECYDSEDEVTYYLPKFIVAVTMNFSEEGYEPDWCFYGDFYDHLIPFDRTPVTAPSDLQLEEWTVTSDGAGHNFNIGFSGDDVFFQGLFSTMPQAWLKGSVEDGKVSIPCGQYIGINEEAKAFCFFYAGDMKAWFDEEVWADRVEMVPTEAALLEYDAEAKHMTTDQGFALFTSEELVAASDYIRHPNIMKQPADISRVPEVPEVIDYIEFGHWGNYAMVEFLTSTLNADGYLIGNDSDFSYRLISDGEPIIFSPGDDYPELEEEMEWIPYDFTDYWSIQIDPSLIGNFAQHIVSYHVESKEYTALQARYIDPVSGQEFVSEPKIFWSAENSVESVSADTAGDIYFNLQGMTVSNPTPGLYIKIRNGKATKVFVK